MAHTTVEMSGEVRLRRLEFFLRRIGYVRRHMAAGEQALLNALLEGAPDDFWLSIDQAIDRERFSAAMTPTPDDEIRRTE